MMKHWDKIKLYFVSRNNLRAKVVDLMLENTELKKNQGSPREIVNNMFKENMDWYDWNELPVDELRRAYKDAQTTLNSEIVHNIKNELIAKAAQRALLEETHDTQKIVNCQFMIVGITLLLDKLEEIYDPDKPVTTNG